MQNKITYIFLTILFIIIIFICIYNYNDFSVLRIESFKDNDNNDNNNDNNNNFQPVINMNPGDINFIQDDNTQFIKPVIINYKLKTSNKYLTVLYHTPAIINTTQYLPMGQYAFTTDKPINNITNGDKMDNIDLTGIINMMKLKDKKILTYLTSSAIITNQYNLVWSSDYNEDGKIFSIWRPIIPSGTCCLGDIIVSGIDTPTIATPCFPITMLQSFPVSSGIIWQEINDAGLQCYCWYSSNMETFQCSNKYGNNIPELNNVYNLPLQYLNNNTISPASVMNKQQLTQTGITI